MGDQWHRHDWEEGSGYAALLEADRPAFAWEWLRRDACYRRMARAALSGRDAGAEGQAGSWGLHGWILPDAPVPRARPVWRSDVHPYVLEARARPAKPDSPDAIDFAALATLVTVGREGPWQHLLLSDGLRSVRVDLRGADIASGPVELCYRLAGVASAGAPLLALRRFLALAAMGQFARTLHPPERRARRWILLLRAHDGLCAGAGHREIARVLLDPDAAAPAWRDCSPSLRLQAQRLAQGARRLASGDWRGLLR